MLYYFFEYLNKNFDLPGTGVFQYITFRSAAAVLLSLILSTVYGKRIINFIRRKQIGATIRELGLDGQNQKAGTPSIGRLSTMFAAVVPALRLAQLPNRSAIASIVASTWMGLMARLQGEPKVGRNTKECLDERSRLVEQAGLAVIVGAAL